MLYKYYVGRSYQYLLRGWPLRKTAKSYSSEEDELNNRISIVRGEFKRLSTVGNNYKLWKTMNWQPIRNVLSPILFVIIQLDLVSPDKKILC